MPGDVGSGPEGGTGAEAGALAVAAPEADGVDGPFVDALPADAPDEAGVTEDVAVVEPPEAPA
ncbi:MAG TPA: hypothetical protein DCQ30_10955 [Acidimicrobiaceae bacterium]|nr:hypothetical protein [Acidimicrobiaceae bacterium]